MIKSIDLFYGVLFFIGAHALSFFQLNGQFLKTDWFRKNEWIVAGAGVILSFFYMWGTKYAVSGMGNLLWPARFIGFGTGMVVYSIGVSYFFNEGITIKTFVSLLLSLILICVQVLWKTN